MVTMETPMTSTNHKTLHTFNQSEMASLDVFPANKGHRDTPSQPITTSDGSQSTIQIIQTSVQSDVGSSTPVTKMAPSNISYQSDAPARDPISLNDPTTNQDDPCNFNQSEGLPVASPVSNVLSPYRMRATYTEATIQPAPPSPVSSSNQMRDPRTASQSAPVLLSSSASSSNQMRDPRAATQSAPIFFSSPVSPSNQMRDPQAASQSVPVILSSPASSSNQMRDPRAASQSAPILFSSPALASNQMRDPQPSNQSGPVLLSSPASSSNQMRDPQATNQSEAAGLTNSTNQQMTQPFFQPKSAKTKNEGPV